MTESKLQNVINDLTFELQKWKTREFTQGLDSSLLLMEIMTQCLQEDPTLVHQIAPRASTEAMDG